MSASKDKGRRAEHLVADTLTNAGIPAKRQPLSGSLSDYKGDVVLGNGKRLEVKNRESIAESLWAWLAQGDAHYLVIKKNHKKPLVLMDINEFISLLTAANHPGDNVVPDSQAADNDD